MTAVLMVLVFILGSLAGGFAVRGYAWWTLRTGRRTYRKIEADL